MDDSILMAILGTVVALTIGTLLVLTIQSALDEKFPECFEEPQPTDAETIKKCQELDKSKSTSNLVLILMPVVMGVIYGIIYGIPHKFDSDQKKEHVTLLQSILVNIGLLQLKENKNEH